MDKKTGGPAFPGKEFIVNHLTGEGQEYTAEGMTLRDAIAIATLTGLVQAFPDNEPEERARFAYSDADAMLKEREK